MVFANINSGDILVRLLLVLLLQFYLFARVRQQLMREHIFCYQILLILFLSKQLHNAGFLGNEFLFRMLRICSFNLNQEGQLFRFFIFILLDPGKLKLLICEKSDEFISIFTLLVMCHFKLFKMGVHRKNLIKLQFITKGIFQKLNTKKSNH